MKQFFLLLIISLLFFSCKKNVSPTKQPFISKSTISNSFEIKGVLENFYPKTVYLNKIIENSMYPIDSSELVNNEFYFKGQVEYPERFAFSYENYSAITVFILENNSIQITIPSNSITDPTITGSISNNALQDYKTRSKQIFKQIDYLYPQFQKYRLENNAEKLNEIGIKMKNIEQEFRSFSYQFIEKNPNSYVSAMILRDQLKSDKIDTLQIENTYQLLSSDVQKSPDSEIIASFLKLH